MRRVVVWISGRGRAANGMVYGSREDGGDPCSVRVTRSHAMLATRALCRLRARVIAIVAKTHIVESWLPGHQKVPVHKLRVSAQQERWTMSQEDNF